MFTNVTPYDIDIYSGYTLCNIFDFFFKHVSHYGGLVHELFTVCMCAASQNCRERVFKNILCS